MNEGKVISLIHEPDGFKYMITVNPSEKLSIFNEIFDYSPKLEFWSNGTFLDLSTPFSSITEPITGHPNIRAFMQTSERLRNKAKYSEDQSTILIWLMIYGQKDPIHKTVNLDDTISTLFQDCPNLPKSGFMKRGRIMDINQTFRKSSVPEDCWIYFIPNIEKFYKAHDAYGLNTWDRLRWPSTFMNAPPLPFVLPEIGNGLRHRSKREHPLGDFY